MSDEAVNEWIKNFSQMKPEARRKVAEHAVRMVHDQGTTEADRTFARERMAALLQVDPALLTEIIGIVHGKASFSSGRGAPSGNAAELDRLHADNKRMRAILNELEDSFVRHGGIQPGDKLSTTADWLRALKQIINITKVQEAERHAHAADTLNKKWLAEQQRANAAIEDLKAETRRADKQEAEKRQIETTVAEMRQAMRACGFIALDGDLPTTPGDWLRIGDMLLAAHREEFEAQAASLKQQETRVLALRDTALREVDAQNKVLRGEFASLAKIAMRFAQNAGKHLGVSPDELSALEISPAAALVIVPGTVGADGNILIGPWQPSIDNIKLTFEVEMWAAPEDLPERDRNGSSMTARSAIDTVARLTNFHGHDGLLFEKDTNYITALDRAVQQYVKYHDRPAVNEWFDVPGIDFWTLPPLPVLRGAYPQLTMGRVKFYESQNDNLYDLQFTGAFRGNFRQVPSGIKLYYFSTTLTQDGITFCAANWADGVLAELFRSVAEKSEQSFAFRPVRAGRVRFVESKP